VLLLQSLLQFVHWLLLPSHGVCPLLMLNFSLSALLYALILRVMLSGKAAPAAASARCAAVDKGCANDAVPSTS
jgi:hypothetical protein